MIFFLQDGDYRPEFDFRKTPDTVRAVEHAFRVQVEVRKFQAGLLRNTNRQAGVRF
jgi:hypothetical protein